MSRRPPRCGRGRPARVPRGNHPYHRGEPFKYQIVAPLRADHGPRPRVEDGPCFMFPVPPSPSPSPSGARSVSTSPRACGGSARLAGRTPPLGWQRRCDGLCLERHIARRSFLHTASTSLPHLSISPVQARLQASFSPQASGVHASFSPQTTGGLPNTGSAGQLGRGPSSKGVLKVERL